MTARQQTASIAAAFAALLALFWILAFFDDRITALEDEMDAAPRYCYCDR